jgi:TonB family protein
MTRNQISLVVLRILLLFCIISLVASGVLAQEPRGIGPGRGGTGQEPYQPFKTPDPQSWQRYTVKGEEFSVTLPTVPAMLTVKAFQPHIQKKRKERRLTTRADGISYTVNVFENPKPVQSLEDFIAEHSKTTRSDLTLERDLTIGGIAGKEYSSRNKAPVTMVQFFATEKRLYSFAATGPTVDNAAVKQFFSSIALGKKTEGIKVEEGAGVPLEYEKIYVGREVDTKARLISKPEPSYTEKARQKQITGTVILKVVFAANGQVTNIRTAQGLPYGLTERAIAAARKIKFIPATKDGRYVSMWMQLEYNFYLY